MATRYINEKDFQKEINKMMQEIDKKLSACNPDTQVPAKSVYKREKQTLINLIVRLDIYAKHKYDEELEI